MGICCYFLLANILIFIFSVVSCWLLGVVFKGRRIFSRWEPLLKSEQLIALLAVFLNALVSVFGWVAWKQNYIEIQTEVSFRSILDCLVMIVAMDLGMYLFHRIAHIPLLYRLMHAFHHRHEATNPISLFVLHPVEVLGFGGLMILFLMLYPMSLLGLLTYLGLNIAFGTLGHSGVEPFPAWFRKVPILKYLGTSTFHAEHHEHPNYNFGFYTLIWDKTFGTLDPEYDRRFSEIVDSN